MIEYLTMVKLLIIDLILILQKICLISGTNVVDQLNIYNFEQNNPNDFILEETVINQNTGPPDIFNSNNIIVQKN